MRLVALPPPRPPLSTLPQHPHLRHRNLLSPRCLRRAAVEERKRRGRRNREEAVEIGWREAGSGGEWVGFSRTRKSGWKRTLQGRGNSIRGAIMLFHCTTEGSLRGKSGGNSNLLQDNLQTNSTGESCLASPLKPSLSAALSSTSRYTPPYPNFY